MQPFDTPPTSAPSAFEPAPELKSPWRPNRLTSGIVAGGVAFAMVLAGLGIASAQTDGSTTTPPPAASAEGRHPHRHHALKIALDTAARTLGMSEGDLRAQLRDGKSLAEIAGDKTDALISALVAAANGRIDAAVADGKITQAQADARKANLTERITALVNRTPPVRGEGRGPGHRGHPFAAGVDFGIAATTLGLTPAELRTQLEAGKSLAEIAGDKTDALVSALVAAANGRIDAAVAAGRLTQAQADARVAELTQRITDFVNRSGPAGGHHHAGGTDGPDGPDGDTAPQPEPASIVTA